MGLTASRLGGTELENKVSKGKTDLLAKVWTPTSARGRCACSYLMVCAILTDTLSADFFTDTAVTKNHLSLWAEAAFRGIILADTDFGIILAALQAGCAAVVVCQIRGTFHCWARQRRKHHLHLKRSKEMQLNLSTQASFRILSILESHHPMNGSGPLQQKSANHIFRPHESAAIYDSPQ